MRIIRFMQSAEVVQLGFDKKVLFIKWGSVPNPMRLGTLEDIRLMSVQKGITVGDKTVEVPTILKAMSKNITNDGIKMAAGYTDDEFYEDFLQDYKDMSSEGSLTFIGEFSEWV